jgi:hypothetical protein
VVECRSRWAQPSAAEFVDRPIGAGALRTLPISIDGCAGRGVRVSIRDGYVAFVHLLGARAVAVLLSAEDGCTGAGNPNEDED